MTIAAFAVSLVALLIALGSLWYTHRADQRADRTELRAEAADRRDAARFAGDQTEAEVKALERVEALMAELAAAVEATGSDSQAPGRLNAQSRLQEAIDGTGVDLPNCAEYARTAFPGFRREAERELERARADVRLGSSTDALAR